MKSMHSVAVIPIRPWNCPGRGFFESLHISAISHVGEMSDLFLAKEADEWSAPGTSVQMITDAALFSGR